MTFKRLAGAMCVIALAGQLVHANVDPNPYASIVDRNPFGLKPPPPQALPPEQTAPPVPMAQVTMTGLLSTFGEPRVLLEIIEEPGKGGGTPKRPPPMREGERLGPVEVLAIDVVKNTVRVRNSGVETNISFPVVKSSPAPGGPGVAAVPPAFTPPPVNVPSPLSQPGAPTVISANNASPGSGVTLFGGSSATPMTTGTPGSPAAYASAGGPGGTPVIPPRPLRTDVSSANNPPAMTRDQAALLIEANRLRLGSSAPPLPPTHLTPIMENVANEGAPPPASPFPQFPTTRPTRPPIPGR